MVTDQVTEMRVIMNGRVHAETEEEWQQRICGKIWNYVRLELYKELRFLEVPLHALTPMNTDGLLAVATDGQCLYYTAEHIAPLFEKNTQFLLRAYLHSVLHCLFRHPWMRKERDPYRYQVAADVAVEYTIDHLKCTCTRRISGLIRKKLYEELEENHIPISAPAIYMYLRGKLPEELQAVAHEFYTDDHRFWPKEMKGPKAPMQIQKKWDKIARQTELSRRQKSDARQEGEQLLKAQIEAGKSRRSYADFLRRFSVFTEELHCDPDEFDLGFYTYGLRVYGNLPLLEPVETKEVHKIREFVIVVDTSDSTSGELVQNFLRETFQILSERDSFSTRSVVRILQCDDRVRRDDVVKSAEELENLMKDYTIEGNGGTDFRPAFTYVEHLREQGELRHLGGLIYFTDGRGTYPAKRTGYRTAFLFLDDYPAEDVPPWAMQFYSSGDEWEDRS